MIYKINIHSVVDVITNSSSVIFVYKEGKTEDIIRQALEEMYTAYKKVRTDDNYYGDELNDLLTIKTATEEDVKYWKKAAIDWDYNFDVKVGDILIESTSDNSIPWGLMDMIENGFQATRFHLG